MIESVVFCSHRTFIHETTEQTDFKDNHVALIVINGYEKKFYPYRPLLQLDFNIYDPLKEIGIHGSEKRSHYRRFVELQTRHPDLPKDRDAEKIIIFANELYKDSTSWKLWIVCPNGRTASASIARFINALGLNISVKGLDAISTEWHSLYLSGLLAYNYGKMFKDSLAEAKKNESNAAIESINGGQKDKT